LSRGLDVAGESQRRRREDSDGKGADSLGRCFGSSPGPGSGPPTAETRSPCGALFQQIEESRCCAGRRTARPRRQSRALRRMIPPPAAPTDTCCRRDPATPCPCRFSPSRGNQQLPPTCAQGLRSTTIALTPSTFQLPPTAPSAGECKHAVFPDNAGHDACRPGGSARPSAIMPETLGFGIDPSRAARPGERHSQTAAVSEIPAATAPTSDSSLCPDRRENRMATAGGRRVFVPTVAPSRSMAAGPAPAGAAPAGRRAYQRFLLLGALKEAESQPAQGHAPDEIPPARRRGENRASRGQARRPWPANPGFPRIPAG